ncbi:hypothetical protein K491DRAFT_764778 [Lophiostoma macrostomum CBS 122681]|uniref:Transcription factor IIIC putative zinc-finger domain-containing protein n=1 Tax=Lophiostoma macrostomum CBS 122681 TaxID=1314788 RepID=A0A6A6TSC9_9PLEO|nr:hypothetical protein K491DRAFT_764778 [Lophiostoma macrostomum CBS 122681]
MSDVTQLKCWPSCVRAIDWSQDGIIALASTEQVELLYPTIASYDSETDVSEWRHFDLKVPWFTNEELPRKDPAPLNIYSIGEEISLSYPIAISWSPPGLAKHRRCALAALTANLTLSIWAPNGKPLVPSNWDRRLIINDTLRDYFQDTLLTEESKVASKFEEKIRLRCRIRAFSWAPSIHCSNPKGIVGTQISWGRPVLAVADDDNHIVLLAVDSPASTIGSQDDWSAEVLHHFPIKMNSSGPIYERGTFEDLMQQQRHVSHLEWSPWVDKGTGLQSVVAYATNEEVRARTITRSQGSFVTGEEQVLARLELRFAGPMVWSPKVGGGGMLTLALFTNTEVVCLTISSEDGFVKKRASHHVDGRWDAISGIAWDTHRDDASSLHFSSQTTTTHTPTAALELSDSGLSSISTTEWPYWREQISGTQAHYSAHHDLKGHANAKVWGLGESPLGDFIAACHTVHPTDMIEYGTPSDRETTISISDMWARNDGVTFPTRAVSAEGIYYTIRRWIEKEVESAEELPALKGEVHQKLIAVYPSPQHSAKTNSPSNASFDSKDLNTLLECFKQKVFLEANTLKDRYEILASTICTPNDSNELPRTLIAFRLARALQDLPSFLSDDHTFSKSILEMSRQAINIVNDLIAEPDPDAEGEDDPIAESNAQPIPSRYIGEATETCTFCSSPIPFENLWLAYCTQGHEFIRCGISFLTIQAPGCTKKCGICDTLFLTDDFMARDGVLQVEAGSSEMSVDGDAGIEQDTKMGDAGDEAGTADSPTEMMEGGEAMNANVDAAQTPEQIEELDDVQASAQKGKNSAITSSRPISASEDHATTEASSKPKRKVRKRDVPVNLARVLFLGCDVCIYCGGKFVG